MRKIHQAIVKAIQNKEKLGQQNTVIQYSLTHEMSIVYLHGHEIAKVYHDENKVCACFCGYVTNTTRDRINSVLEGAGIEARFKIKNGEPMLGNLPAPVNGIITLHKTQTQTN